MRNLIIIFILISLFGCTKPVDDKTNEWSTAKTVTMKDLSDNPEALLGERVRFFSPGNILLFGDDNTILISDDLYFSSDLGAILDIDIAPELLSKLSRYNFSSLPNYAVTYAGKVINVDRKKSIAGEQPGMVTVSFMAEDIVFNKINDYYSDHCQPLTFKNGLPIQEISLPLPFKVYTFDDVKLMPENYSYISHDMTIRKSDLKYFDESNFEIDGYQVSYIIPKKLLAPYFKGLSDSYNDFVIHGSPIIYENNKLRINVSWVCTKANVLY